MKMQQLLVSYCDPVLVVPLLASLPAVYCHRITIPDGKVEPSGHVTIGNTATVQCNDGYQLKGVSTLKCVAGDGSATPTWDNSIPSCQSECVQALHMCMHVCVCV